MRTQSSSSRSLALALLCMTGVTSWTPASEKMAFKTSKELEAAAASTTFARTGTPAPVFDCVTVDGRKFDMTSQKGRVVLLAFFDPGQKHTINSIKNDIELEAVPFVKHWRDIDILCIARGADQEQTRKVLAENGIKNLHVAADPANMIFGKYASRFVPRFFVIGRDGKVAFEKTGSNEILGVQGMKEALSKALQAKF